MINFSERGNALVDQIEMAVRGRNVELAEQLWLELEYLSCLTFKYVENENGRLLSPFEREFPNEGGKVKIYHTPDRD